ncbi:phospholipase D-like domain-containing protein [Mycoplasma leonicaptivi]|uniref:phospholipase D-like domain-containing protein n=1 Tax=Mycoplasma leonicaptivi TaxID=36742 RepID=UPI000488C007|nr:phosphatidylserine/phosphatidylglycerophosphate/cardiolipin synthase family protein [Mycoplasma leonicaptivi]
MKRTQIYKSVLSVLIQIIFLGLFVSGIVFLVNRIGEQYIYTFFVALYLSNVVFIFIIYSQQRNDQAKFSWIYLLILIPIIGHIAFLAFGLVLKNKHELKINQDPKYFLSSYKEDFGISEVNTYVPEIEKYKKISNSIASYADFKMYSEGYHFYNDLLENLKKAKKNIFIVTYIIKNSEISNELIEIIKKKQEEGVDIKWLVDDFGAIGNQKKKLMKLTKKNKIKIKIIGKIYYPFIHSNSFSRNHQKFIIIDNEIVFSGGNNISDEYASLSKKYGHWIDVNYKITGPYVNQYNILFCKFWKIITKEELQVTTYLKKYDYTKNYHSSALLTQDSPSLDYSTAENFWLTILSNAKHNIKIATPYFSLTNALEKQLIIALKSGIDITIYFPGLPDKKFVYKISLSQLSKFIPFGLKIKIYDNHFLHSKMGVVDDKYGWLGTNNLDSRSMFSQYETMDIVSGNVINDMQEIFKDYDANSSLLQEHFNLSKKYNKIEKFVFDWFKTLI